ncbi:MAG: ywqJ [Clostridia bacterium]|jgi:hypothetical protein|nr:ywqJ [Clostridia bacterium]
MQTRAGKEKQNEQTHGKSKRVQNKTAAKKSNVRTTELTKMIQLVRDNPNSLSWNEFMLLQSVIGYRQAVTLLKEARRQQVNNLSPDAQLKRSEDSKPIADIEDNGLEQQVRSADGMIEEASEQKNIITLGSGERLLQMGKKLVVAGADKAKGIISGLMVKFKIGNENHKLWVEKRGTRNVVMMASKEEEIKAKIEEFERLVPNIPYAGSQEIIVSKIIQLKMTVTALEANRDEGLGQVYLDAAMRFVSEIYKALRGVGKADLDAYRGELGVFDIETAAVGRTTVKGMENLIFKGASPQVRKAAGLPSLDEVYPEREIRAPYNDARKPTLAQFTRHAEEGVIAEFEHNLKRLGIRSEDVKGTLYIHQSNPGGVCNKCTKGLILPCSPAKSGIFYQLTVKYPNLLIRVTSEILDGARVNGILSFELLNGSIKPIND